MLHPSMLSRIPGQQDDPTVLLSPRPRSWSAAQREALGQSSPEVVERLLGALLGNPTATVTHEGEGGNGGMESASTRDSSASPDRRASFTPTDPPSSSAPSDPRSSAYTLAYSQLPSSSSPSSSTSSSPPRGWPSTAPSPHSLAAQEVLATLAAMSQAWPDERAPSTESEQTNAYRRLFDSAGLSAVEERTEERTVASGSMGSQRAKRVDTHAQNSSPVRPCPQHSFCIGFI